ncbi:MAG TPA: YaeQ family protein [Steroidobacteraceae bacterium]
MAVNSTMYVFTVRLADADRSVYVSLTLRVAQHPSETLEYLVTRVLAYCLEYTEGIAFSKGLSEPEEPAISVRDLTGALHTWIDIGAPEAARLHKASKAARRVAVYAHRDVVPWFARIAGDRIYRSEAIEIYVIDRSLVAALASRLERRMDIDFAVSDRNVYVSVADQTYSGTVELHRLPVEP